MVRSIYDITYHITYIYERKNIRPTYTVTAAQWKSHSNARIMSEYKQQVQDLRDTTTTGGGSFAFSDPTTTTNNSFSAAVPPTPPTSSTALPSLQPPPTTSSLTPISPFSYNSFVKKEESGHNRKLRDNTEFCVVLCDMVYNNNLPFTFVESAHLTKYNNYLYEYIMRYQSLPVLPSRKVVSGTMKAHIFDMQQEKIRFVSYMFLFLYVLCLCFCSILKGNLVIVVMMS